jgi:transposase
MAMATIAQIEPARVTVGVDTHADVHVAAAKDQMGRHLSQTDIPTTPQGYRDLLTWAQSLGQVEAFGIEGTGSYGAGLARFLRSAGQVVIEVNRPKRQDRRRNGKSDPADAEAAARAVLSGDAAAIPKNADDIIEMIRVLRSVRKTAMRARTQAINAMTSALVTAPAELREQLRKLSGVNLVRQAVRLRPGPVTNPTAATKKSLRSLGLRYEALEAEIKDLDVDLARLTTQAAPCLLERFGVGPDSAGALLVAAGDNPERLSSDAAFSMLCGSSPVEASSGKTKRYRLNRGGDRQANSALYRIVLVRMRYDQVTKDYVARRTTEGKSKREIIRCLKRYVAREVYDILKDASQQRLAEAA